MNCLQIKPIKHTIEVLASILTHIFNLAVSTGLFPEQIQISRVMLIHKGGDENNTANYEPISILPTFSKELLKILHSRRIGFFDKRDILSESQLGFLKKRSTEIALL